MRERNCEQYTRILVNGVRTNAFTLYYNCATEWNVNFLLTTNACSPKWLPLNGLMTLMTLCKDMGDLSLLLCTGIVNYDK